MPSYCVAASPGRLPKERSAWAAGRGRGRGVRLLPAGLRAAPPPGWLRLGWARGGATGGGKDSGHAAPGAGSSEAVTAGAARGLAVTRFRQERPRESARRGPLLHAAPGSRTEVRPPRSPHPRSERGHPRPPPHAPAATPVPTSAHPPRDPRPLILRLLGRLAAASPARGPPLPLSSAPRPPPRRPPEPGTRNPRRGLQRACAGLFPRTCENARWRGRLPSAHLCERPRVPEHLPARPDPARRVPPAPLARLGGSGPGTHRVRGGRAGSPAAPSSAPRRGRGDVGGRPQPPAGRAGSGLERAGAAPSPGQPAPRPPLA